MVLAERITHFYRQYGTHDGTVIELDTGKNWQHTLSGGELQKIMLARCLNK